MHDGYVRERSAQGEIPQQNPSLRAWDQLEEPLRQSNRRFAEGIEEKLAAAGCRIMPAKEEHDTPAFRFSAEEIEELARMEHERWVADLERDGWRPGPDKDPGRKTHPMLVPWSRLSEAEREKDRAAVRRLPEMLARAGLRIERA